MVQATTNVGTKQSSIAARHSAGPLGCVVRKAYPLIAGAVASALTLMQASPALAVGEMQIASAGTHQVIAANSYRLLHLLETGKHSSPSISEAEKSSRMLAYANMDESLYGPEQSADSVPRASSYAEPREEDEQSDVPNLSGQGKRVAAVYLDSRGNPTIGMGFNLRDDFVRSQVLNAFRLNAADPRLVTAEQRKREQSYIERIQKAADARYRNSKDVCAALDGIMQTRAADPLLAVLGEREPDFRFNGTDDARIRQVFDNVLDAYKRQVKHWLPKRYTPDSKEYSALVSLAFNSRVHTTNNPNTSFNEHGTPITLGSRLRNALMNDDRAEAWYEIRYNTNPDGTRDGDGIAKRRYVEADTFGLYPAGSTGAGMSEDTARDVMATYTRHRANINGYDRRYAAAFRNAEQAAPGVVRSLKSWLAPARNLLSERYVRGRGINVNITGDVLVMDDSFTSQTGTERNDLIFAGAGSATVHGGAGDDVIVADRGQHTLMGDAGFDRYEVTTGIKSVIEDSDGIGAMYLNGKKIAGGVTAYGNAYSDRGEVRYQRSGSDLVINNSVTIRNFYDGMLGIRMVGEAAVAAAEPAPVAKEAVVAKPAAPVKTETAVAVKVEAKPVTVAVQDKVEVQVKAPAKAQDADAKPIAKPAAEETKVAVAAKPVTKRVAAKPAAPTKTETAVAVKAEAKPAPKTAPAAIPAPAPAPIAVAAAQPVVAPAAPAPLVVAMAEPQTKPTYPVRRYGRPGF